MTIVLSLGGIVLILLLCIVGRIRLELRRDCIFIAVLLQAVFYLFIAPSINASLGIHSQSQYARLQLYVLMLFFVPLILFYRFLAQYARGEIPHERLAVDPSKAWLFAGFLVTFEAVYLYTSFTNAMIFRRIGSLAAAEHIVTIDPISHFIIRSHDLIALPVVAYIVLVLSGQKLGIGMSKRTRYALVLASVVGGGGFFLTALVNSRLEMVLGTVLLVGAVIMSHREVKLNRSRILKATVVGMAVLYAAILVANVRWAVLRDEPLIAAWNPTYSLSEEISAGTARAQWVNRIDCLDLMARMEPSLAQRGYEWGDAWKVPLVVSLGQYVAPNLAKRYKATGQTTAKAHLIKRHTGLGTVDYYSCAVTDAYGNFGPLGFIFTAFIVATLVAMVPIFVFRRIRGFTSASLLIGMVIAYHVLTFEQASIAYLIGWVRYVPILVVFLVLNPLKRQVNRPGFVGGSIT